MVCQWPWGTFATKRLPFGAQPRSGSMLVFVHVSSMNTRRLGSIRLWRFVHWARRRATSGRSRSLATTVFFEAELLGVNKIPHRPIIDLKPALSQFGHQPAQGEGPVPDAPRQKSRVLAGDRLGLMPAHLARRDAPRLPKPPHPINHRARRDPEAPPTHAATALPSKPQPPRAREDPSNKACPSILASCPASTVNQNTPDSGIPTDSAQCHPALGVSSQTLMAHSYRVIR